LFVEGTSLGWGHPWTSWPSAMRPISIYILLGKDFANEIYHALIKFSNLEGSLKFEALLSRFKEPSSQK
jgi:hypothetical protein